MTPQHIEHIARHYASAGAWDRFHVRQRLRMCPHEALLPYLPESGSLLDLGCGFGVLGWFLAAERPAVAYYGADIDARKIALAKRAFAEHPAGSRAHHLFAGDVRDFRDRPARFSTIAILDVLLLMPLALQRELLDFSLANLEETAEACLLLKILPKLSGRHRYRTWLQESIMVHVLKKTMASGALFTTQDPAFYADWGRAHGLTCQEVVMPTDPPSLLLVLKRAPHGGSAVRA